MQLKCAKVAPLSKQGDRDDLNNYRPNSVVANFFKESSMIDYKKEISSQKRRHQTQIAATWSDYVVKTSWHPKCVCERAFI